MEHKAIPASSLIQFIKIDVNGYNRQENKIKISRGSVSMAYFAQKPLSPKT